MILDKRTQVGDCMFRPGQPHAVFIVFTCYGDVNRLVLYPNGYAIYCDDYWDSNFQAIV